MLAPGVFKTSLTYKPYRTKKQFKKRFMYLLKLFSVFLI